MAVSAGEVQCGRMGALRVRSGNPGNCSRILRVVAGFAAVLAASCGQGGGGGSNGFFRLQLVADQGVDLTGANRLALAVTGPGLSFTSDYPYPSDEIELADVTPGLDRVFRVEMTGGTGGTIASGTSDPEDLVEGTFTTVIVILKEPT